MVLAIGIVVDDAIVVVEAVHAKMEHGINDAKSYRRSNARNYRCYYFNYFGNGGSFIPVTFIQGPTGVFINNLGLR